MNFLKNINCSQTFGKKIEHEKKREKFLRNRTKTLKIKRHALNCGTTKRGFK